MGKKYTGRNEPTMANLVRNHTSASSLAHVGAIRALLEGGAIENGDMTASGRDQSHAFQGLESDRDTRPRRPEHHAEELVGEGQLVAFEAVCCHQQPAHRAL